MREYWFFGVEMHVHDTKTGCVKIRGWVCVSKCFEMCDGGVKCGYRGGKKESGGIGKAMAVCEGRVKFLDLSKM